MSFLSNMFSGPTFASEAEIKETLKGDHLILDVRSEMEFAQGHITGAVNVPVHMVSSYLKDIKEQNKKVILYCRSGARASSALSVLQRGGVDAINAGGIMNLHQHVQ